MVKNIGLLGATGSIGRQTLEVVAAYPDRFRVVSLSFGTNVDSALPLICRFRPRFVSCQRKEDCEFLRMQLSGEITVSWGEGGLVEAATFPDVDVLVNAVTGSRGLLPTLEAIRAKKTIALANKETLVTAGHLVMNEAKKHGVEILPVDSEHSAIFQCLQAGRAKDISRLILTASGGSFRDRSRQELQNVTVADALQHPNWSMGAKITVDSATMMNKGLEVIEAHWLFGVGYEQIDVLLHKESIIHSLVEFVDANVVAQLGLPDMRGPIQYALTYPDRLAAPPQKRLNLGEIGRLHFDRVSFKRYRCLSFAYEAGKMGGSAPTVLNAANEAAVQLFLNNKIAFLEIEVLVEKALERHQKVAAPGLEEILNIDRETRAYVHSLIPGAN